MDSRYLLDSWAILALIHEERPAAGRVEELLHLAAEGKVSLFLSLINLGEIFYIVSARHGVPVAESFIEQIKSLPIQLLTVDESRVLQAAKMKSAYRIAYADAFAAAGAMEMDAVLLTGDPELLSLSDVLKLEPLERAESQGGS